jgi:acetyl-CoA carboxylase carboxyltransferase component
MGKMTAPDRILSIVDEGSFHEYDMFVEHVARDFDMDKKVLHGDGVIIGTATIYGSPVCLFAQDFTVAGGSLGLMHARKITKIMDHSLKMRVPLIGINDSGGARIQEGVDSLAGYEPKSSSAIHLLQELFRSCRSFLGPLCRRRCLFASFDRLCFCSR